jgi:Trk K+ transport system NAD-binding subunit
MKFLTAQLLYFFSERQTRQNLVALLKYLLFLWGVIGLYSVLFHIIMVYVEGQEHSWITGLYWTLTVMSTLGFGDITFNSDLGRLFSIVVLLSGIVLLLIMLPFAFIRYFYAPWLEAQIRSQAPRMVPPTTLGHVVICKYDSIAQGLIRKLDLNHIPYYVIEPDPVVAAHLYDEGIAVITGEVDSRATYEQIRVAAARLVFANAEDTTNTNIILTIREVAPAVPIVALAARGESIDILELSGATHVLPLKQRLGDYLANRINVSGVGAHLTGRFKDVLIAEFPVHHTPFSGLTIRDTRLRESTGINVVAVWERGHLLLAHPDTRLSDLSVAVVMGSEAQLAKLDNLLVTTGIEAAPVVVIGGGRVGRAVTDALKRQGMTVHMVERNKARRQRIGDLVDRLVIGDAADRQVLMRAGLHEASSVVLTTNDDAINIYLAVYCRRLTPKLHIVSRITHERNVEAIHRAGADVVLSYASLGSESVFALLQGREPVLLGEGIDLFLVRLPDKLVGNTLGESDIGASTGLIVIGIQEGEQIVTNPPASLELSAESYLLMVGTAEQRQAFAQMYGQEA